MTADGTPAAGLPKRLRVDESEEPVPRHLRSMLSVSRAATSGRGLIPVLEALAAAIHGELSFNVVAVNLRESPELTRVVIVHGETSARELLLDSTNSMTEWQSLTAAARDVHGAAWLAAGSYDQEPDAVFWRPPGVAPLAADGWRPDDMLLLPLRSTSHEVLGIVSVDQPLLGRRPTDGEIGILMAVVDHAGLALEQVQQHGAARGEESDELRLAAVMLLAEALDLRDLSTALHSRTVGLLARRTAIELGLADAHVERVGAAGVLHDLGKLDPVRSRGRRRVPARARRRSHRGEPPPAGPRDSGPARPGQAADGVRRAPHTRPHGAADGRSTANRSVISSSEWLNRKSAAGRPPERREPATSPVACS